MIRGGRRWAQVPPPGPAPPGEGAHMTDLQVDETELTEPLLDPSFYAADPYPLYARLRDGAPVAFNRTLGLWFVSRHAEVVAVSYRRPRIDQSPGSSDPRRHRA